MTKKSFILYCDNSAYLDTLTDAQAGQLLRAIFAYQCDGEYVIPCPVPEWRKAVYWLAAAVLTFTVTW